VKWFVSWFVPGERCRYPLLTVMAKQKSNRLILKAKTGLPHKTLAKRDRERLEEYLSDEYDDCNDRGISCAVSLLSLAHLGFTDCSEADKILKHATRFYSNHFLNRPKRFRWSEQNWFEPFALGMLPAALLKRRTTMRAVFDWLNPKLEAEWYAGSSWYEKEIPTIYKGIVEWQSGKQFPALKPFYNRLFRNAQKRTRILYDVLVAAENHDSIEFGKLIKQSLKLYQPKTGRGSQAHHWVAKEESIILALAEKKLKAKLDLDDRGRALIMSRESLGLSG
jgi:hypothetical protein